jgi:hypothetical protein
MYFLRNFTNIFIFTLKILRNRQKLTFAKKLPAIFSQKLCSTSRKSSIFAGDFVKYLKTELGLSSADKKM